MKGTIRISITLLACILGTLVLAGCTNTIIPPTNPPDPTMVLVTDYGRHSSLLLPDPNGGLTEYAFGDWTWYALGHQNAITAIFALFDSPQSTLGRRWLFFNVDAPNAAGLIGADRVQRVTVAGGRVAALRDRLNRQFANHIDKGIFSPQERLYFIPSDEPYNLFHNCNRETADWLEELGAKVDGADILPHFRVTTSSGR